MMNIGVRAHDFGTLPPDESAAAVALPGVSCIQLALSKALRDTETDPVKLGPQGALALRDAYSRRGVSIAVLGCYINPVHPDPAQREAGLRRFEAHLRFASDFGCRIVGTETGSLEPDCSYHPETANESTFRTFVGSVRRLASAAETAGRGIMVGIEPVARIHTISTAALMRRLLDEIASPALGVIFDPTNLVPPSGPFSQDAFLSECFDSFGDRIVAVHAKDYRFEKNERGEILKIHPLPAGSGELDWPAFFRGLRAVGKETVPILLENAGPRDASAAIETLTAAWDRSLG